MRPSDAPTEGESADAATEALADDVAAFLRKNFPQIAMHGGSAAIRDVEPDTGEVWVQLSGACGGCGISPMTTRAIQSHLPTEIPGVTEVHVETVETRPSLRGESPRAVDGQ